MKKIYAFVITLAAITLVSCGDSKTEKAEEEKTADCVCEKCECNPCVCEATADTLSVESIEEDAEESLSESVVNVMKKSQTKASQGSGACRHANCRCQAYRMAHDGSGGKCVCGHWDYVHN